MRVLVADDDESIRRMLTSMLSDWGYTVIAAASGDEAWQIMMAQGEPPPVAILDWNMPGLTGTDVIRHVRSIARSYTPYLLLLTAKDKQEDIVEGLRAGASDYIIKPFDYDELQARLQVGVQMVSLQLELGEKVKELQIALEQVKSLQGLLPICAYCKKIRDDQNYWHAVENYISANSDVHFTHGICPDCYQKVSKSQVDFLKRHHKPE
jgi:sigma-B regulation protein RsbU (phosphoserine phosphatase)